MESLNDPMMVPEEGFWAKEGFWANFLVKDDFNKLGYFVVLLLANDFRYSCTYDGYWSHLESVWIDLF
jgi:hypothetical protein